jgi:hypothetical protein
MYFDDHAPPHFHARYGGQEALIVIATGDVYAGSLPGRALRLVREWREVHREELARNFDRGVALEPPSNRRSAPMTDLIKITGVGPLEGLWLRLRFSDGAVKDIDLSGALARGCVRSHPR